MRTRPGLLRLALVVLPAVLGAGTAPAAPVPPEFIDPADPGVATVREVGERTIDHLARSLLSEVQRVLRDTKPAFALDQLHLKDYAPPPSAPGRPTVTAVRRTSLRIRDPNNAPDAADLAALIHIESLLGRGEPIPRVLVQRTGAPGSPDEWRVYRPLASLKQCSDCHGPPGSLAPGVADALRTFFPADQAVGFEPGAWRGLIRVSIQVPQLAR